MRLAPGPIEVRRFDDYIQALEKAKVILDADRRKDVILHDARDLAFARGLELVEDEGLLEEVAGLVEWPVVLLGAFDEAFLDLPAVAIRATIRKSGSDALAPAFILVSNLVASDGGLAITAGNERVVRARLSDAKFFWETDKAIKLEDRLPKLDSIVFHEKLGTQGQRVARISDLAEIIAREIGADQSRANLAAKLAKADLVTEMVGEFAELQGVMGRYYADLENFESDISIAIEEHYKPVGPSDRIPANDVATAVSLADKIDTLICFWTINEKPTGSKDPFALRRSALGVIRNLIESNKNLNLYYIFAFSLMSVANDVAKASRNALESKTISEIRNSEYTNRILSESQKNLDIAKEAIEAIRNPALGHSDKALDIIISLMDFIADRLKVYLRDQGARHDLVDAVFALPGQDDLLLIVRRVEALQKFLETEDGKNLLAGYKRAANILRIVEKKDGRAYDAEPDAALAAQGEPAERALSEALRTARAEASKAVEAEDFAAAMRALSTLRAPVDAFFTDVTVNADDSRLRENRLALLSALRAATREVADFSKIEG